MAERGLLDLIIARLPGLSYREKTVLCGSMTDERDLTRKSGRDLDLIRMLAERDASTARLLGINWVSWVSPAYPPLLREIYDPPTVLFFRGRLPDPELPLVAVVGTRKPSPQAAAQAFEVAGDLGFGGVSVVSGLAMGTDAMAHRGNLEGGGRTVAVLGSGVDGIYPASNRALARRILETGGALISEYPPGTSPRRWTFPARNRIVSGLSRGVLVVEAPEKSGALITARFALEHNRDLWVASAGVATGEGGEAAFDRRGTRRLAGEGAAVVRSGTEILEMWGMEAPVREPVREPGSGAESLASSLARSLDITL